MKLDFIFLHGFYSSPKSNKIANIISNIRSNREINQKINEFIVPDLYATPQEFENMTLSSLIGKIEKLINQSSNNCILYGSSHGGLLATHLALRFPEKITCLILLAPAVYYLDLIENRYRDGLDQWKQDGYIEVSYNRWEVRNKLRWSWEYIEDLKKYKVQEKIQIPTIIIHGLEDNVVPVEDTKKFVKEQKEMSADIETEFIKGGVHHLGNVIEQVTEKVLEFVTRNI